LSFPSLNLQIAELCEIVIAAQADKAARVVRIDQAADLIAIDVSRNSGTVEIQTKIVPLVGGK
jgi:hypothetical protein